MAAIRHLHERVSQPTGADATLQNVGPERRALWDPDEMDVITGNTSGFRHRGKPNAGSREWRGL